MEATSDMHEALFQESVPGERTAAGGEGYGEDGGRMAESKVRCLLCPHGCVLAEGATGRCRVRTNRYGSLRAVSYGHVSSLALDPIEKKPLAHFYPGSFVLSMGSWGCNLGCLFCQNHSISQQGVPVPKVRTLDNLGGDRVFSPEELVSLALETVPEGNIGIAYTYNEPFCDFEFMFDTARAAKKRALKNVVVTNGFVRKEPLVAILPFVDAMNIDLKAFTERFYRKVCGGSLEPVLDAIGIAAAKTHVEITTLVIPGLNSSPEEIDALSSWIATISPDIPLHLNRHHPDWKMSEPPPIARDELYALSAIARAHLRNVHVGNV
jgi:pyruvate formate lyase activating enzyme